jgi:hypothetical protein
MSKTDYEKYCQAKKILHLAATHEESQIIRKVVQSQPVSINSDNETRILYSGRMSDDYDYCPLNLVYGNLPSDEVMFAEKGAYNFFSTDFSKYDMVIVWHSTDVRSLVFFYCMCHKFMRLGIPLYEVDIRLARELAAEYARKSLGWVYDDYYVSIESLGPRFMMDAPKQVVEVSKERLMEYDALWKAMIDNPTGLRALKEGKVVSVPEDYYDELILSLPPEDGGFKRCVQVVGESLSNLPIEEDGIGAEFFFERIIDLSQMGKLKLQLKDDFDFKAYKATKMLMEGFSEEEVDKGWLHDIWPPMQAFMVRRI